MHKIDLSKELAKVHQDISIKIAGNGWIVEFSGRSHNDDWKSITVLCPDLDTLTDYLSEYSTMEID